MSRTKRILMSIGLLLFVQVGMFGLWYAVESNRTHKTESVLHVGRLRTIGSQRPAPNFRYQHANGSIRELSQWKGRALLVHFWATWCPPCRKELPSLRAFAQQYKVQLLAVSVDTDWETIHRELGTAVDASIVRAVWPTQLTKRYAIQIYPTSYIIHKKGYIQLQLNGARNWNDRAWTRTILPYFR